MKGRRQPWKGGVGNRPPNERRWGPEEERGLEMGRLTGGGREGGGWLLRAGNPMFTFLRLWELMSFYSGGRH